jgi:hypothetical protein
MIPAEGTHSSADSKGVCPRGRALVRHLRAAVMLPTVLTSNVGGLRLERGLGVTVIRTSLPSKSRNPTNRSTEKSVSRPADGFFATS